MKTVKFMIIVAFTIFFAEALSAQSLREDMTRVSETLESQRVQFSLQYTMYASHTATENKIQEMGATYLLWDQMYVYKTDELYLLTNNKMTLSVDHDQKRVMINRHDPADKRKRLKELTALITDSVRSRVVTDTLLNSSATLRTWRVKFRYPVKGIDYIDISINPGEGRIEKMVYYYSSTFQELYDDAPDGALLSDRPRLEIRFTDYKALNESDRKKYFSGEDVVKLDSRGNATLIAPYGTYKLSNYYNLKK